MVLIHLDLEARKRLGVGLGKVRCSQSILDNYADERRRNGARKA